MREFPPPRLPVVLTVLFCSTIALPVLSHPLPENLSGGQCEAPVRPVNDQNDVLWSRFLADVDLFRACVNDAAAANQAASDEHQKAARAAVERWNLFVRHSLNAPKDFPWEPANTNTGDSKPN